MSFSLTSFFKNPLYRFLLSAVVFYMAWYLIYELWLHPYDAIDLWIVEKTMKSAQYILNLMGFVTFQYRVRLIGIDGTGGLWMGDNCDSIELCGIFMGFIIAFPGFWKHKLWYIPMGIVLITMLNVLRVVALAIIQKYFSKDILEFNHSYTFTILVYGFIFLLWYIWIKKIAKSNIFKEPAKP
jgi:exosortase family protein XrtF